MTHPQTQDYEALVEVMARAAWAIREHRWPRSARQPWEQGTDLARQCARQEMTAALTALRNHEGRK